MSSPRTHPSEERLRALLASEAEDAMTLTDTEAQLRRFRARTSARRSTRRGVLSAAAALAALATAGGAVLLHVDSRRADLSSQTGASVDAAGTLAEPVPLPRRLGQDGVALRSSLSEGAFPAGGALWHVARDGTLERIDPSDGELVRVDAGVAVSAPVVEAAGLVWFAGGAGSRQRFYALDPATNAVVRRTPVVDSARWIASGSAGLWAVTGARQLSEIEPATGAIKRTLTTEHGLYDVLVGRSSVYSGSQLNSTGVTVVDVASGQSRLVLPQVAPGAMALTADGDLWIHDLRRPALVRYDGATFEEQVAVPLPLPTSRGAARSTYWSQDGRRVDARDGLGEEAQTFLAVTEDALYASLNPGSAPLLLRADVLTGDVTHVFRIGEGGGRGPITVAGGSLWLDWKPGEDVLRRVAEFD